MSRPALLVVGLALVFGVACMSGGAGDCPAVGATGTIVNGRAEVITDRDGRRTVHSAEGVEIVAARDGTIEVRGTDGKKFVVTPSGSVSTSEREVHIITVDGERQVYDASTRTVVTEESYSKGAPVPIAASASGARTGELPPKEGEVGEADGDDGSDGGGDGGAKTVICHVPPGNPANQHTLSIGSSAVDAHLKHGDYLGECDPARAGEKKGGPPADKGGGPSASPKSGGGNGGGNGASKAKGKGK